MLETIGKETCAFQSQVYKDRYQKLQQYMANHGLQAHLIRDDLNIIYLTGATYYSMERPVLFIALVNAPAILVVPKMEEEHLQGLHNVGRVAPYWEIDALPGRDWLSALRSTLADVKSLGVEPSLEAKHFSKLVEFKPQLLPLVEEVRLVKSDAELLTLQRSGVIASERMEEMLKGDIQGMSVGQIVARGMGGINDNIAERYGSACKLVMGLQAGILAASPHHISSHNHIIQNEPCVVNSIVSYQGYNTECERTVLVGEVGDKVTDIFKCMLEAQSKAIELIKPGESCAGVDIAIQKYFTQAGYGDCIMHRVGHGMGLLPHERPYLSEGSSDVFTPGMVVSCEPGLYVKGIGGFRHSDTLVITEQGHELLTHYPSDLNSQSFNQ